ncbi:MAG: DUF4352 domain-containing protein [Chloroflexi bacterium]|nr:DUF4352 domain-containing protein [Chloroflexota bacterium]
MQNRPGIKKDTLKLTNPVATVIASLIGAGALILVTVFTVLKSQPINNNVILQLPSVIPSLTPKPTVVGTPVDFGEYEISARGQVGFTVIAGNITLVIDEVNAYRKTNHGFPPREGYIFVVVKIRIVNGSHHYMDSLQTVIADDLGNRYAPKIMAVDFGLPELPALLYGDSGAGAIVYEIPEVALRNNLRFLLEPIIWAGDIDPTVKIEILLPSPLPINQ